MGVCRFPSGGKCCGVYPIHRAAEKVPQPEGGETHSQGTLFSELRYTRGSNCSSHRS